MSPRWVGVVAWVIAVVAAAPTHARPAVLKEKAKFRAAASATSDLLTELPAGAKLEVLGEEGGWRQVQTPDGQMGYVWAEHLAGETPDVRPAGTAPRADGDGGSLADDVRALRAEVHALAERPDAENTELDKLREEIQRLVTTQEGLMRRLEQRAAADGDPVPDTTLGLAPFLVFIGVVVGWVLSRITQRRRDHRQRDRLRL